MGHKIVCIVCLTVMMLLSACEDSYKFKGKVTFKNSCLPRTNQPPPYRVELLIFSLDSVEKIIGVNCKTDSSGAFDIDFKPGFKPGSWRVLKVTCGDGSGRLCKNFFCEDTTWGPNDPIHTSPGYKDCLEMTDYKQRFQPGSPGNVEVKCGCQ